MPVILLPVAGIPEVQPGDDLGGLLAGAIRDGRLGVKSGDVLVVCQKVVSKAEGRIVALGSIEPSTVARAWAERFDKDPRLVELVLRESTRILRMQDGHLIVETGPGWICANAGIDESNASAEGFATLLPVDPDRSAADLRAALRSSLGADVAVIVTDTWGRPWREGQVEFALGVAGLDPLLDLRGSTDRNGHELRVTVIGVADELASAAGLLMGKNSGIPAVLIRGWRPPEDAVLDPSRRGASLIRPRQNDLFR